MRVLFLFRAMEVTGLRYAQDDDIDDSPEEAEWLRDFEAAQRSSAVSQETFGNCGHVSGEDM